MTHTEYIIPIGEDAQDYDEMFIGVIRRQPKLMRCKDCIHRYSTCPMITVFPDGTVSYRAQDDWFCFMGDSGERRKEND